MRLSFIVTVVGFLDFITYENLQHYLRHSDSCFCQSGFLNLFFFFFSSRRRHTRLVSDWSSDVCSSDLANLLPAPSAAGRARLPLDVAGAMAGRARFLDVHRKGLAGSVKRLVERDLDAGLDIAAARALAALEEVLEPDAFTSRPSAATAHVAEDRAKEVGEVAGAANVADVLDPEPSTGTAAGRSLGVTLPIRAERVVTAPLHGIRQHLVGFVDLLEPVGGVLAPRDVRVVLPREPPIGGLDRLVLGLSVDS